jgi:ABC-type branched-subunit amino acid transport system permease subunit
MVSFPIAVGAGFGIGLSEEWVRHYLVTANRDLFQGAGEVLTLGAVIVVLALRPKWIFKGIREDEDSGVTGRAGAPDSLLGRLVDPVEAYRAFRAAVPTTGRLGRAGRVLSRVVPVGLLVFAVMFPLLPGIPNFWTLPVNFTLIYALVVLSFVVLVGWLGQISVAQGAFLAVGGAGAAICTNTLHLPFPFPILGGVLLSIPISVLVGLPALRLRGLHLAVATLAFGLAAERAIVPRFDYGHPVRLPEALDNDTARYYLFLVLTVAAFALAWRILKTRVGRSFFAIRDSETVAAAYGIRPVRVKLTGFIVSGGIAALAGTLITYQLGGVQTQYASVFFSISWLVYAVIGGITSIFGPIVAALAFGLYPELTKAAVQAASISFIPEIVASGFLILIMAVNPEGLASMARFVRARASAYEDRDEPEADLTAIEEAAAAHVEQELVKS